MTSPRNISKSPRPSDDSEQALSSSVARATAANGSLTVGTPPLPQIPRRDVSGSFQARSMAERSNAKGDEPAASSSSSVSGLGNKAALPAQPTSSALTASLTLDKDQKEPIDRIKTPEAQNDGTLTPQPDESAFSAVAGVPDEEKAKVLRRHLVSAEERGTSAAPTPSTKPSPAASPGPGSRQSETAGESSLTRRSDNDDDPFPIPYDAPGGDVT